MTLETEAQPSMIRAWMNRLPKIPFRDDKIFAISFFVTLFLPLLFVPVLKEGYETPKFVLFLLASGTALVVFAYYNLTLSKSFRSRAFVYGLAGFYILLLLSSLLSMDFRNSLYGTVGRSSNSLLFFAASGIYFLLLLYSLSRDKLLFLLKVLVAGGAITGLYGLLQHEGIGFYAGNLPTTRLFIPSFLGNPNFTSMYLALIVPVGIYLIGQKNSVLTRVSYGIALLLMIWGIAQSSSRAAILALFVSLALILVYSAIVKASRNYLSWTILAILFALSMSAVSFSFFRPNNINQSLQFQDTTQQYRLVVWDLTIEMIKQRPLLGTGPSNYYLAFKEFGWSPFASGERFDDPHNVFLAVAANNGLPAAVLFTAFLLWVLYLGIYRLKNEPLNIFLSAGVIAWIVAAMFGPVTVANWVVLILLSSGIIYNQVWQGSSWSIPKSARYGAMGLGGLVALAGLILIYSHVLNQLAYRAYNDNNFEKSLAYAEKNIFSNLTNTEGNRYLLNSRIRLGKPAEETESILESLVKTRDNSATAHLNAATVYFMLWQQTQNTEYLDKMSVEMDKAVALEKNYSGIYAQVAYLWFKAGNAEKAITNQRVALSLNPNQFYGWVLLARLHYDAGEKEPFLKAFEKAYMADPSSLLLKYTFQQFKAVDDIRSIPFPVYFPDVESMGGT